MAALLEVDGAAALDCGDGDEVVAVVGGIRGSGDGVRGGEVASVGVVRAVFSVSLRLRVEEKCGGVVGGGGIRTFGAGRDGD